MKQLEKNDVYIIEVPKEYTLQNKLVYVFIKDFVEVNFTKIASLDDDFIEIKGKFFQEIAKNFKFTFTKVEIEREGNMVRGQVVCKEGKPLEFQINF
jgi:hypothetical protein